MQRVAFYSALGMLLVKIAVLPELLFSVFHVNTYLLYLVGPPAMVGGLLSGAVGRTMKYRSAWYWLGFSVCLGLSIPFSSWVGGSVGEYKDYVLYSLPFLFVIGGLVSRWGDVRGVFYTIAVAGLLDILAARLFATEENGRMDMLGSSGTIGNSNDLASHLVLVLPFLLFVMMDRRRNPFIRYSLLLPAMYGGYVILGTASRGALIALVAMWLFSVFKAAPRQRLAAIAFAVAAVIALPVLLGHSAQSRLSSLLGGDHVEARASEESRSYLLKMSILYTIKHPVFGVGLAQFSNFEGGSAKKEGKIGNWHETHNAFTEVSSENGVPALVFFVMAIGGAFLLVNQTYRRARAGGFPEIANACFCYLMAMVGYMVTITFLANAYRFYLPVMVGLAIAMRSSAEREMSMKAPARTVRGLAPAR